jgi:hypothetical protein
MKAFVTTRERAGCGDVSLSAIDSSDTARHSRSDWALSAWSDFQASDVKNGPLFRPPHNLASPSELLFGRRGSVARL